MAENSTRLKLMKTYELLLKEADEANPISRCELCIRLNKLGIECSKKTLTRNIAALNDAGYEVCACKQGREKYYYVPERDFSIPELKILIDAVQAANFVTEQKTGQLIDKIAALGGSNRAELLKRNRAQFNTRKHSNSSIYYNIDGIEDAISRRKQLEFNYFSLDERMEPVFHTDSKGKTKLYRREPIALVLNEDNYYLLTYHESYEEKIATYRVDRMKNVRVVEEVELSSEAEAMLGNVPKLTARAFKMHSGEAVIVKLLFNKNIIGPIVDKFGEGLIMRAVDDGLCTATVEVQVSKTFYGWLAQFGSKIKIAEPARVREEYCRYLEDILAGMRST